MKQHTTIVKKNTEKTQHFTKDDDNDVFTVLQEKKNDDTKILVEVDRSTTVILVIFDCGPLLKKNEQTVQKMGFHH